MPLIYREGEEAIHRPQREVNNQFGSDVAVRLSDVDEIRSVGMCRGLSPCISVDDFVGCVAELDQMAEVLQPGELAVEQRRLILGGIGGIGQDTARYCLRATVSQLLSIGALA